LAKDYERNMQASKTLIAVVRTRMLLRRLAKYLSPGATSQS
jgi:hypothetical protein